MKKLISTLAAGCLVALATTPAKAQLPGTGSVPSSGNSSILSTGSVPSSGNSSILSTGSVPSSGNSSILSTGATSTTDIANILSNQRIPTILTTSEAKAEVKIGPNGIDVDANASSGVQVGDLIKLNTCSNAHVTVGSSNASPFASCSHQVKARKVPESSTIFGLTLLGAFLIFSRRKSFSVTKAEIIRQLKIA